MDGKIFLSPETHDIDKFILKLKNAKCDIEDQGSIREYLGVNVKEPRDDVFATQPHLIDQITTVTGISPKFARRDTSTTLTTDLWLEN